MPLGKLGFKIILMGPLLFTQIALPLPQALLFVLPVSPLPSHGPSGGSGRCARGVELGRQHCPAWRIPAAPGAP